MKITLVRHGETEANYLSKIQGRSNPLLNDTGRRQCQKLRNRILEKHYDVCYTSPLIRCVETTFILIGDRVKFIKDDRLMERDMGKLEGKDYSLYDKYKYWDYDLNKDPNYQRRKALARDKEGKEQSNNSKNSGSSKDHYSQLSKGVKIEWDDDPEAEGATYTSEDLDSSEGSETAHSGKVVTYDELPQYAKDIVDRTIGENGHTGLHRYYFQPFERGFFGDTEAVLEIIPYKVTKYNSEETSDDMENDPDLQ
jgi:bisphosphoglycerate-dependent phosphoglycerate mutase